MQYPLAVVTTEILQAEMAGPAIRAWELAQALARAGSACTLIAPQAAGVPAEGIAVATYRNRRELMRLLTGYHTVIADGRLLASLPRGVLAGRRVIADMVIPYCFESLENNPVAAGDPLAAEKLHHLDIHHRHLLQGVRRQLACADLILCGTERHRDCLLGMLTVTGAITPSRCHHGRRPEDFVLVVPHGVPNDPPAAAGPTLPELFPAIGPGDTVFLWWGCGCDWYDWPTLFRAMAAIGSQRQDIKFVLAAPRLAGGRAAPPAELSHWLMWAQQQGLLDRTVFVLDRWIPYAQRGAVLQGAAAGIYTHRRTLETHFSIRTRFYDYLWAGLPVIVSDGDAFAPLVREHGCGMVIGEGDSDGWAAAFRIYADDQTAVARMRHNLAAVRPHHTWDRSVAPLVAALHRPPPGSVNARFSRRRYAGYLWSRFRHHLRRGGLGQVLRSVTLHIRKLAGY